MAAQQTVLPATLRRGADETEVTSRGDQIHRVDSWRSCSVEAYERESSDHRNPVEATQRDR